MNVYSPAAILKQCSWQWMVGCYFIVDAAGLNDCCHNWAENCDKTNLKLFRTEKFNIIESRRKGCHFHVYIASVVSVRWINMSTTEKSSSWSQYWSIRMAFTSNFNPDRKCVSSPSNSCSAQIANDIEGDFSRQSSKNHAKENGE